MEVLTAQLLDSPGGPLPVPTLRYRWGEGERRQPARAALIRDRVGWIADGAIVHEPK